MHPHSFNNHLAYKGSIQEDQSLFAYCQLIKEPASYFPFCVKHRHSQR